MFKSFTVRSLYKYVAFNLKQMLSILLDFTRFFVVCRFFILCHIFHSLYMMCVCHFLLNVIFLIKNTIWFDMPGLKTLTISPHLRGRICSIRSILPSATDEAKFVE